MSKECDNNYDVSKGTLSPLSNHDIILNCILVPSWTGNGIFRYDWNDAGGTCKRKRQIEPKLNSKSQRRRTNLDKLFHETRQCDACARDILWTPSLQQRCFSAEDLCGTSSSQKSVAESLPRFIELHIPCQSPLPCSFCMKKSANLPWCGSLYCSKTCQIEAENGVATSTAPGLAVSWQNLPPPKLYFCRNRFRGNTIGAHEDRDLVNEIVYSLSAIEKRLQCICGYDASDLGSINQMFRSEECALLLTTMMACLCPSGINKHLICLSENGIHNSSMDKTHSEEASLVEEFWAMSRTYRSIFIMLQKRNDGNDTISNTPFPCYNDFFHCYLDIKRSCIVRVDALPHPLVAYATTTVTSSALSDSEQESVLDLLMPETDLPTSTKLNNDPIHRWRNSAHLAHWFSQSTSADGITSGGVQTHLHKSYFAFSSNLFRRVRHSCVPTVALTRKNSLVWLALHNYQKDEMTISKLDSLDGDRITRSAELKKKLGFDFVCTCERCQYEAAPHDVICSDEVNSSTATHFSRRQLKRLGDLAMQQGRFEDASKLYGFILLCHPCDGDVLHARAASYLGRASSVSFATHGHCQGYFTLAQQLWDKAGKGSSSHADIAIQLRKQLVYKTIDYNDPAEYEVNIPYTSLLDGKCHLTTDPIISLEECRHVINTAEKHAASKTSGGWTTSRHYAVPTTDLPLYELKEIHTWFYQMWNSTIRPLIRVQFKLSTSTSTTSDYQKRDVFLHDAFVVRYDAEKQRSLPPHYDESTLSFIVTLNSDFKGGGTYIHCLGKSIAPNVGCMLSFCGGDILHSGDPVVEGVRYIIAAFCYVDLYGSGTWSESKNLNDFFTKDSGETKSFAFEFK